MPKDMELNKMSGMVNADELMVLAFAVCDERATDAQIERIEEILDGNRAAKLLYLECLDLHSDLEYRGRRFGLHRPVAEKIITAQIGEFLPDQLLAEPAAHPGGDGPAAAHGTVPVIGYPWRPLSLVSSVPWAAYAMAGLLLVIGVLAAWTWRLSGDRPDSQLAGGVQVGVQISATEAPAAGKTATPPILERADRSSVARWRGAEVGPSAASKPPRPIVGRITAMSGVVGRSTATTSIGTCRSKLARCPRGLQVRLGRGTVGGDLRQRCEGRDRGAGR